MTFTADCWLRWNPSAFRVSLWIVLVLELTLSMSATASEPNELIKIEFNRDIRPILSDNCFYCHGPDAGHRQADLRLDDKESALMSHSIVPGDPDASKLIQRILSEKGDEVMPPPESQKKLTPAQKFLLKRWIEQGAEYQRHWSYEPLRKPEVPDSNAAVDYWIDKKLKSVDLTFSAKAEPRILVRRLYADLIGLPPTPERVEAFAAAYSENSERAYRELVEELLANPHYGERMAIWWLDAVRFADTIGYHSDNPRNVWPYRDWVIKSFNANKRFDQFTLEQIAGDLLPNANQETQLGSAFNRLLLSTEEGGAQPKDYEARMLTDRVRAIGSAWMGQTTGCAQCHDHKFDPITIRDFYSLGAFFADIEEPILGRREPGMLILSPEQQREHDSLVATRDEAQKNYQAIEKELEVGQQEWERSVAEGKFEFPQLAENATASADDKRLAKQVSDLLRGDSTKRKPPEKAAIEKYYHSFVQTTFADIIKAKDESAQRYQQYIDNAPKCLVSKSTPNKRMVRILPRGDWMDETGEKVSPAIPSYLPQLSVQGRELNRLDLAQWLVSRENPLTARNIANRIWRQFFGIGISRVLDDLGAQGEPPVNAELLDWLACEFVDSGWDMKHLIRTIVHSRAYQQTSTSTPALLTLDPNNRWCARQTAFRLDAELVRDYALSVSGLLVLDIGGPSVKPYQPDKYWENLNFPTRDYVPDRGPSQYRRGLYTWWQRSFLHPSLQAFDAPSREECAAERTRSNIPQQALVLLNDPMYVEAARLFAERIHQQSKGSETEKGIELAFKIALQRAPSREEATAVRKLFDEQHQFYKEHPDAAKELLKVGFAAAPPSDQEILAAWTHVARVLLNLHETITRS